MAFPLGLTCHYCGKPASTWDHIVPRSKGGPRRARWNQVASCRPCNEAKKNNDPTCECMKCQIAVWRVRSGYKPPSRQRKQKDFWSSTGFQKWYEQFQPRGYRG